MWLHEHEYAKMNMFFAGSTYENFTQLSNNFLEVRRQYHVLNCYVTAW